MKKLNVLIAGLMTAALLAGCGSSSTASSSNVESSDDTNTTVTETQADSATNAETDTASTQTAAAGSGKVLVAYFSASGNTKAVAEKIADATGGDLFEIQPADPYTDDDLNWTDENSRVNKEHEDESLQDVALAQTTPDNFDSYDTVFIGYPIWWQDASWVVDNFAKDNDFTGKTVIPFCTSSSSPIGDSGKNLEQMAGTGTWLDGQRFSGSASDSEVQEWVDSLNLN